MTTDRSEINRQIVEEAATWFVELNEGEPDRMTRRRFHQWLSRSPEHVRAYLEILPIWEEGVQLDTYPNDPAALVEWARAACNVVPLGMPESFSSRAPRTAATGKWRLGLFAAAASVLVAVGLLGWLQLFHGVYATGIGEQRRVTLSDGSRVELNARSRLRVRFSNVQRSIELIEGQALFSVVKDKTRPFVVRSGDAYVRAVGTQFDVYRKNHGTVVTVMEGRVAVGALSDSKPSASLGPAGASGSVDPKGDGSANAPILLAAGEQVIVAPSIAVQAKPADVAIATAWTQQRLVFSRTPLTEVAEEFNRYNKRPLVVKDSELGAFSISGTFSSADPISLIRFLRMQPGIHVRETSDRIEISTKAG